MSAESADAMGALTNRTANLEADPTSTLERGGHLRASQIDRLAFSLSDQAIAALLPDLAHRSRNRHGEFVYFQPTQWLNNPALPQIALFYAALDETFRRIGFRPGVAEQTGRTIDARYFDRPFIAYHTHYATARGWNAKISYLPECFTLDRRGYSGWSQMTDAASRTAWENAWEAGLAGSTAPARYVAQLRDQRRAANASKIEQPSPSGALDLPERFVFVPLQIERDAVIGLSNIDVKGIVRLAVTLARRHGVPIVFKRHPRCTSGDVAALLAEVCDDRMVRQRQATVHDLISKADAVLVLNSGVGFEALVHGRCTITLAPSDYRHVTFPAGDTDTAMRWLRRANDLWPLARPRAERFVQFYQTRYVATYLNPASVERQVLRILLHSFFRGAEEIGEHSIRRGVRPGTPKRDPHFSPSA